MTNEMIANIIEEARAFSAKKFCTVYLMSNGENLVYVVHAASRRWKEEEGYWVAMIFENGYRVEA